MDDLNTRLETSRPAMVAFARRYVSPDDAEDVVQQASLAIWLSGHRFRGESAWLTFALAVVKFAALNWVRAATRRRALEAQAAPTPLTLPAEPLLRLTVDEQAWLNAYVDGTAPGSASTQYRKLRKIRRKLEDA